MTALLLLLAALLDNHPEIGTVLQARVEHSYTCETHTATFWERVDDEPWRVVRVVRTPTGADCAPGELFDPSEEGM